MMADVLILLPPSEGKAQPVSGDPVDLDSLTVPELSESRRCLVELLGQVSAGEDAAEVLGVGPSVAHEVLRNTQLWDSPAAAAHQVYTGVLFDALGYSFMTSAQKAKAKQRIMVVSALWGVVGLGDSIPAYRLSMNVKLPKVGRLATWWKPKLAEALQERVEGELVVDCRSSTYQAAYAPPPQQTVAVDVVQLRQGQRKVVSHFAKHTRGEVARLLIESPGAGPTTPADLLTAVQKVWPHTELAEPTEKKPGRLTVVLPEDHTFNKRN